MVRNSHLASWLARAVTVGGFRERSGLTILSEKKRKKERKNRFTNF